MGRGSQGRGSKRNSGALEGIKDSLPLAPPKHKKFSTSLPLGPYYKRLAIKIMPARTPRSVCPGAGGYCIGHKDKPAATLYPPTHKRFLTLSLPRCNVFMVGIKDSGRATPMGILSATFTAFTYGKG